MSMRIITLLVVSIAIPCTWGVFDGRNPGSGPRPGDQFPVTGNLLQCVEDATLRGFPFTVGVGVIPGQVFKPDVSRYRYPADLNNLASILTPLVMIINQLNISNLQAISRPSDFDEITGLPRRYIEGNPDMIRLQELCGADVLASVNSSNRNVDQPYFEDINTMLQEEWLTIWGDLTPGAQMAISSQSPNPARQDPADYETAWRSEQRQAFSDLLQVLTCRVAFRWQDAGPTYIPRYFFGGYCLNRNCSVPDRDEFRCHADLSDEAVRFLEAARWDCCWTYTRQDGYEYQCGFRKVRFPIVCDCDCRCLDKAGTK